MNFCSIIGVHDRPYGNFLLKVLNGYCKIVRSSMIFDQVRQVLFLSKLRKSFIELKFSLNFELLCLISIICLLTYVNMPF